MCIRTVMTYASPVFAHAAPKALHRLQGLRTPHYFQIYEGRIEAILRHRGITSQCVYARRLTINRRIPPTLSVGHETVGLSVSQVIDLSPYSTRPPLTASGRAGGREPTRDGFCDILCRDDFHQASSIAHVTRRRHSHVPSGRTR
ncbi:hypothetical protein EVAR_49610_1 [Eumeta japonica]|uniref:Uncharacterized protein n=1 Tax=Eumeta variegata TaxID=151549 RepID=A0A4C1Y1R1_EUMVA|nr:hypothetical protein EVAR_49610_1 [Eumeta japonica]